MVEMVPPHGFWFIHFRQQEPFRVKMSTQQGYRVFKITSSKCWCSTICTTLPMWVPHTSSHHHHCKTMPYALIRRCRTVLDGIAGCIIMMIILADSAPVLHDTAWLCQNIAERWRDNSFTRMMVFYRCLDQLVLCSAISLRSKPVQFLFSNKKKKRTQM